MWRGVRPPLRLQRQVPDLLNRDGYPGQADRLFRLHLFQHLVEAGQAGVLSAEAERVGQRSLAVQRPLREVAADRADVPDQPQRPPLLPSGPWPLRFSIVRMSQGCAAPSVTPVVDGRRLDRVGAGGAGQVEDLQQVVE